MYNAREKRGKSNELARSNVVGQCLVLVLVRGEPARGLQLSRSYLLPLQWCASAVAAIATATATATATTAVVAAAVVAVAAATVQQKWQRRRQQRGEDRRGANAVLRSCLQHCKAAPQPRETGQKKRK